MNLSKLLKLLLPFIKTQEQLVEILRVLQPKKTILESAKAVLGIDASPRDYAPDELGCAESLANVINAVEPSISPTIVSTTKLFKTLDNSNKFERTLDIEAGNILISPTGYGNGGLTNGHCGVFITPTSIASNDSIDGIWKENYTLDKWIKRYRNKGGYPLYIFKYLG